MPTVTFSVAVSTDDSFGYRNNLVYANIPSSVDTLGPASGGTNVSLFATRETGFYISVAVMRWDTSPLPDDAVVTGANLLIYPKSGAGNTASADGLKIVGDWFDFGGTAYDPGVWPSLGDWKDLTDDASATALPGTLISSLTTDSVNSLALAGVSNINLSGYTGIRLGCSQRAADAAPSGYNGVAFASYDDPTNPEPQLQVTYTSGALLPPRRMRSRGTSW